MHTLDISENIYRLRHERKITQEQLAAFIGVTKASVSKWETGQSTPDIILLPQLAAYFDVSVDALIGYRPQLSKEQIQKLYQEFASDFASLAFDEVMKKTQDYVKRYYSCYPFLIQICVLWLNHYRMSTKEDVQAETLSRIVELCGHIRQHCRDLSICSDSVAIEAIAKLSLNRPQEDIDALEDLLNPVKLIDQSRPILTQAYTMAGKTDQAESFAQISLYNDVLILVRDAAQYLVLHMQHLPICIETIRRIEPLLEAFSLTKLNPNCAAAFEYQAALCYALHGKKKEAIGHLECYTACLTELFQIFSKDNMRLQGDDFFNQIETWFEKSDSGACAPRSRDVVLEDCRQTLSHPMLAVLEEEPAFQRLKTKLKEIK